MILDFINNLLNETFTDNSSSSNDNCEILEAGKVYDETSGGTFGERFTLHVIPVENHKNLFTNRISYNTQTNAYYENGILTNKYLKKWAEGAYEWDNIKLKIEYDWKKIYLARIPSTDRNIPTDEMMNDDGEITWKFDYRIGGYIINSLILRLSYDTFDDSASVHWFIKPLPTMKNPNPNWKLIQVTPSGQDINEIRDVTQFVKDEYGFILKVRLSGGEESHVKWQKSQLFRQNFNVLDKNLEVENDETFGLDVQVELKPDIIVEPLVKLLELDDSTRDFVIHYESSADDFEVISDSSSNSLDKETKDFNVHSKILSNYFGELLESKMGKSQDKSITLTDADISYKSLEIIINYLYTDTLPNIESYDDWVTLLRDASKFFIPTLIQRCEKELKDFLNHDNLDEIKAIADENGAEQLLLYCENFEPPTSVQMIKIDEI
ncbi:hypothetical protein RclHR1_16370004 [Rhizophagus clarus]|uniref:Peptide-N(4)-(N-acetyl-beta-glucosaminyl) asparagine amidase isoform X1 n=1 Tax=Rhizophagus clarus TaxID=94130 RepID=A0A2Z6QHI9_9GLOM|nr:hypothetical protein RclHR1_16370004 [Rhizophagus clarus]GET03083.1 peptide-N(4)-(N-acetyl-beta-glucosaminyl) asparagine amidase isoform X1 [Rhizophagus clarus]